MKVIFSHGKESGPFGSKIKKLSEVAIKLGFETVSVDYRGMDAPSKRIELLNKNVMGINPAEIILVGSSMGGYVSTVLATQHQFAGLFLMCPALFMEGYEIQEYPVKTNQIIITHGYEDNIIPFQHSIKFGREKSAKILLVNDGHRLSESHQILIDEFNLFLKKFIIPLSGTEKR